MLIIMNRYLSISRSPFSHQAVQYLLVDVGYPMTNFTLENCVSAVETVIALACSIRGGNRIPGFGVSAVGSCFENIVRLDAIKGNYEKFKGALHTLNEMVEAETQKVTEGFKEILLEAVITAIEDFKSKSDNTGGVWQFSSQLQIILLTKKSGMEVQQYLEEIVQEVPTTKLKKIMVVELICPLSKFPVLGQNLNSPCKFPKTLGFVELTKVIASKHALEEYFKNWLLDSSTDHEHLRIIFTNEIKDTHSDYPNCLQNQNLVLKCDVSECIINPLSLPFGNRYMVQTDFIGFSLGGNVLGKGQGSDLIIYELVVITRLSSSGICESLLFGQPLRLTPTQCWRLEWMKLLENQQCFTALCKELTTKEEFLLVQLKPHLHSEQVSGYFILVPGEGSLLLKAIAPRELTLPDKNIKFDHAALDGVPDEVQCKVLSSLGELPFSPDYNPQHWKSGLHAALAKNLLNNRKSTQVHEKETKELNQDKDAGKIQTMDIPKQRGATPNLIVKEAINKTNSRGKDIKKIRAAQT